MISLFVAALAQAVQPVPATNFVAGYRSIPDMRGGPTLPYPEKGLPALNWTCEVVLNGENRQMTGTFGAVAPLPPGERPLSKPASAPVAVTKAAAEGWAGEFTARVSPHRDMIAYTFAFKQGEDIYDVLVKLPRDPSGSGSVAIAQNRYENVIGQGKCRAVE